MLKYKPQQNIYLHALKIGQKMQGTLCNESCGIVYVTKLISNIILDGQIEQIYSLEFCQQYTQCLVNVKSFVGEFQCIEKCWAHGIHIGFFLSFIM